MTIYFITYEDYDGDIHHAFASAPNPIMARDQVAMGHNVYRIITVTRRAG